VKNNFLGNLVLVKDNFMKGKSPPIFLNPCFKGIGLF
jgi:hypothetical protein